MAMATLGVRLSLVRRSDPRGEEMVYEVEAGLPDLEPPLVHAGDQVAFLGCRGAGWLLIGASSEESLGTEICRVTCMRAVYIMALTRGTFPLAVLSLPAAALDYTYWHDSTRSKRILKDYVTYLVRPRQGHTAIYAPKNEHSCATQHETRDSERNSSARSGTYPGTYSCHARMYVPYPVRALCVVT